MDMDTFSSLLSSQKKTFRKKKKIIFFGFLILIVLALVSSFILLSSQQRKKNIEGDVEINIRSLSQSEIVSGSEITFFIDCKNQSKISLEEVEIELQYPDGFTFIKGSLTSANKYNSFWKIGELIPQNSKTLEITGRILKKESENVVLSAVLRYKPKNFNSFFEKKNTFVLKLFPSSINLVISSSKFLKKDENFSLKIKAKNLQKDILKDLRFLIETPNGFVFEKSNPSQEPRDRVVTWEIGELKTDEEKEFEIFGKFSEGLPGEKKDFQIKAGSLNGKKEFQVQNSLTYSIEIIQSFLDIKQKVNGQEEASVELSKDLNFEILIKNISNFEIKNLNIEEELDLRLIDLQSVEVKDGLIVAEGNLKKTKVKWNIPEIKPSEEKNLSFKAKLVPVFIPEKEGEKNIVLEFFPKGEGEINVEGNSQKISAEAGKNKVKIISNLNLEVEARFFDEEGNQIGQGSLPPENGKKTVYRIYFKISSGINDLKNAKVETILSPDAIWQSKAYVSQGNDLEYKRDERKVVWDIGRVLANTGSLAQKKLNGYFEISIIPQSSQVGKLIQFTQGSNISGEDELTGTILKDEKEALFSDLKYDLLGKGKGEVK